MPAAHRESDRVRPDPRGKRPDQALWRPGRQQRHRFRREARRTARHDRPERRRQDDILQDADLRGAADVRPDRVRGPRHHRHERDRRLPARPDQELSGQSAFHPADRARKRRRSRRSPSCAANSGSTCCASLSENSRPRRAGRAHAGARRSHRPRRVAGRGAGLWREAAPRGRPGAGELAEPASARRAARRHEPARARRDGQAAQIDRRRAAP